MIFSLIVVYKQASFIDINIALSPDHSIACFVELLTTVQNVTYPTANLVLYCCNRLQLKAAALNIEAKRQAKSSVYCTRGSTKGTDS